MSRSIEEKRAAKAAAQAKWRAKKISDKDLARSDASRAAAESKAGKRGPGKGSPASSVKEAEARVMSQAPAAVTTSEPEKTGWLNPDWRAPTKGEIAQVKFAFEMGNKPLVQLERDLAAYGIVGDAPCPVKPGEIPMSEKELEFASESGAAAMLAVAPSFLPWLSVLTFGMFSVGFVGSRLLIFLRIKRLMDKEAKAQLEREEALLAQKRAAFNGAQPAPNLRVHDGAAAHPQ